jgi:predicted PurR-regulated permease PerM
MTGHAFDIATFTFGTIADMVAVLVIAIYLVAAPELYVNGGVSLVPPAHRPLALRVLDETGRNLRRWLLGQLADMVVVGGLSAIGLDLLGVPVPFALATLAGLLTIVPYIGAITAGLVAVIVALTQGWAVAAWAAVVFTVCHAVEGYIVAPVVQHHLVRLPPALIVAAMTIGAAMFGALGVILGTPLVVAAIVVIRLVYIEHILGDRRPARARP